MTKNSESELASSETFETFIEFGELESILSILGTIFLVLGLIIKQEYEPKTVETCNHNKRLPVAFQWSTIITAERVWQTGVQKIFWNKLKLPKKLLKLIKDIDKMTKKLL